ncbi:uncharacterized protein [Palaemon carinicauda]|uniref:uncharacterized protein n=1 Tax=Palaemon carinicauda TaxID=392227 RepID=UPI0035B66D66
MPFGLNVAPRIFTKLADAIVQQLRIQDVQVMAYLDDWLVWATSPEDCEDQRGYKNYLRITPDLFQAMVDKLTPHLQKQSTFMRESLQIGFKLAVTLRFLATGNSYQSLQYSFRVDASTICKFIPEVSKATITVYKDEVLHCPKTEEAWKEVAASIVLLAVAYASYKFLYVDVAAEGGASDGGTWSNCSLHDAVEDRAGVPQPEPLPNDGHPVPYHFVGDDAFAL